MLIPEPIRVCRGYQVEVWRYVRCDRQVHTPVSGAVLVHCACRGAWTNFDAIMQIAGSSLILIKIAREFDDTVALTDTVVNDKRKNTIFRPKSWP